MKTGQNSTRATAPRYTYLPEPWLPPWPPSWQRTQAPPGRLTRHRGAGEPGHREPRRGDRNGVRKSLNAALDLKRAR